MVVPTNLNPRFFNALDSASDAGVEVGISLRLAAPALRPWLADLVKPFKARCNRSALRKTTPASCSAKCSWKTRP